MLAPRFRYWFARVGIKGVDEECASQSVDCRRRCQRGAKEEKLRIEGIVDGRKIVTTG